MSLNTVKPVYAVTSIKQHYKVTLFLTCHRNFHMNWTSFKRLPVLRGHFFLSQWWPHNTGLTVVHLYLNHIRHLFLNRLRHLYLKHLRHLYLNHLPHLFLNHLRHLFLNHLRHLYLNHLRHLCLNHLRHLYLNHLRHLCLNHLRHLYLNHLRHLCLNHLRHLYLNHLRHLYLNHWRHLYLNHLRHLYVIGGVLIIHMFNTNYYYVYVLCNVVLNSCQKQIITTRERDNCLLIHIISHVQSNLAATWNFELNHINHLQYCIDYPFKRFSFHN
jgi:hypothetical protein